MKISAIIPVYKNKKLFLKMLKNNIQYLQGLETIVVDDASGENLKRDLNEKYPDVKVVVNKKNLGFSPSVNIGVSKSQGDLILLLNSDVKLMNDSFKGKSRLFREDKDLFAISFMQIEKDENLVGKNKLFYKKGLFQHKKAKNLRKGRNAWAEGGASLLRKDFFDKLSGFDELYTPFYWEDIDLSYRAYKRGWKVLFDPAVKVEHHHESTIGKFFDRSRIKRIAFRNQFFFIWKNLTDTSLFLTHLLRLPYNLVYFFTKGETEFISGFLSALTYVFPVMKRRKAEKSQSKLKDRQILKLLG